MDKNDNPLLRPSNIPYGAPPLDQLKTENFKPAIMQAIVEARAQIDKIKNSKDIPTFENTIEALEFSGAKLNRVFLVFSNIAMSNASKEIRAIESEIEVEVVKYSNEIMLDADLFTRVKAVYDQRDALKLDASQSRLLEETYKGFVRSGALLDNKGKEELRKINERLTELSTTFNQNEVKSEDSFEKVVTDANVLRGLPERALKNYAAAAKEKGLPEGQYLIKLSPPPTDIMDYAENRGLREEIYRAQFNAAYKGPHDNSDIILETVRLRQRMAEILGFKNYAAFALDNRMAKTPENVLDFIEKNAAVYRPSAEDHLRKVKEFAARKDGVNDIQPWDFGYYNRLLKEETFNLKLEDLRPYFELEAVMNGLRTHAEKLFGIRMTEEKNGKYPVYHPDVKVYEVTDAKSGDMIGVFYADYYARPGAKSGGAWAYKFRGKGLEDGVDQIPLVTNVCNFEKPTADQPSLLSYSDVITVFHEFGHALHTLLAQGKYGSLNGTAVKRDFVELPSQVQENWAGQKEVLDSFARHYKTGEPLSDELIKKIKDMENFDAGYAGLRQIFLSALDMAWHTADPATIKSVEDFEDAIVKKYSLFDRVAGPMSTVFGHIFSGGYAAGYYGYKWAEVLDAQVFDMFLKTDLYDRANAEKLRKIYEKGNNEDPDKLFFDMTGAKPDPTALFRREGLLPPQKQEGPRPPTI